MPDPFPANYHNLGGEVCSAPVASKGTPLTNLREKASTDKVNTAQDVPRNQQTTPALGLPETPLTRPSLWTSVLSTPLLSPTLPRSPPEPPPCRLQNPSNQNKCGLENFYFLHNKTYITSPPEPPPDSLPHSAIRNTNVGWDFLFQTANLKIRSCTPAPLPRPPPEPPQLQGRRLRSLTSTSRLWIHICLEQGPISPTHLRLALGLPETPLPRPPPEPPPWTCGEE